MDEQQDITRTLLTEAIFKQLTNINFYRFCQLMELQAPERPLLGTTQTPATDPIRFRPVPGMGFPASELKQMESDPRYPQLPPTIRTTFLGLYGVDAVLPYAWIDDIIQRQEGHDALEAFLDIFNHRVMTQYYRIWLKYYYPASFRCGGTDPVSSCLLALVGFGIKGASEQIAAPASRFLALLGLVTQRTRTADGLRGIVSLLMPTATVEIQEFYPVWADINPPAQLLTAIPISLKRETILGRRFRVSSHTVHIVINPTDDQLNGLLPGGESYNDLIVLLKAYLGYRIDIQLSIRIKRSKLPMVELGKRQARLGFTSLFAYRQASRGNEWVQVNLGRHVALTRVCHKVVALVD